MKTKNNIFSIFLVLLTLFFLTGCNKDNEREEISSSQSTQEENSQSEADGDKEKSEAAESSRILEEEKRRKELEDLKNQAKIIKERNKENSIIYVKEGTDATDDGFLTLIKTMEKEGQPFYKTADQKDGIIGKNHVVLLKVNCQWDQRGGTNVDLVQSVINAILDHPEGFTGEIVVADNGQKQWGSEGKGGSLSWEYPNSKDQKTNLQMVIDEFKSDGYKVSGYLFDSITTTQVLDYDKGDETSGFIVEEAKNGVGVPISYPKFTTEFGSKISFKNGIWEGERFNSEEFKIINMPVLKSHSIYQVTGAVKNYMGTTSEILVNQKTHYAVGKGAMGPQMTETKMPDLNIMDAIYVTPEGGPASRYEYAAEVNTILASTDPVAIDAWASKNILMDEAAKVGHKDLASLDPDGDTPGTFGYWLSLSLKYMEEGGHNFTKDFSKILAYDEGGLLQNLP